MALARRWLDAHSADLDSEARALEQLASSARTSAVYAPVPGDDEPGWTEVATRLRLERPGVGSRTRPRAGV
ncbi:MAG: hypothetical protein IPK07_16035 [Deltaproteobacteria bacterium]|jgi:hypothetical protein|nr:hypothetical protein [Deltaproteobacteria bacterium]